MFINKTPINGNYGNPHSTKNDGDVLLPDNLIGAYIEAKGFVNITLDGDTVTAVEVNTEEYNAYVSEHTEQPEQPTDLERLEAQVLYTALMTDTIMEG